ncbi:hypothetical protein AAX09_04745 [Moraxella bovoculi]|uniref:DUF2523 family protein n=1 Tax=Moraxella bovoculi TaxID=386891 RepID=UPI0006245B2C|nr:DUF2523 family protein [Moraxella bovoculi]AKG18798.1 hypothetical protein AAX09_04705 [Moraxella bovoculi]AKG18804.1 hypothetical protein AAX09_04745 [Moraxella bovoculi]
MFKVLFKWLNNLLRVNNQNWLAQILAGGGIGLATIAGLNIFIDYYKSMALSEFGQLGAVSGLLGLAGIDKAISIIIGAYLASVYIKTFASGLRVIRK